MVMTYIDKTGIEVVTLFKDCGKNCPYMEIDSVRFYSDNEVQWREYSCKNLELCSHIYNYLQTSKFLQKEHK